MGGGTSRFEDTNWDTADGKLTSCEETIDNANPTSAYGVYHLTKLGVNQRDYHVTDKDSNLLYATRAVEGTLAWFDVLGQGMDEYLLRVQVDLSRRYWVVYRYGVPAFAGQACDLASTLNLSRKEGPHKLLFRRACITVSWARYHAIVDFYEPAPPEKEQDDVKGKSPSNMLEEKKCDEKVSAEDNDIGSAANGNEPATDSKEPPKEPPPQHPEVMQPADCVKDSKDEAVDSSVATVEATQIQTVLEENSSEVLHTSETVGNAGTTMTPSIAENKDDDLSNDGAETDVKGTNLDRSMTGRSSKLEVWSIWVKTTAVKTMEAASAPYLPADREEGVITLNNPVLKVQEINSLTGQHQTMLIQKEEVQQLKVEELMMEAQLAAHESQAIPGVEESAARPGIDALPHSNSSPLKDMHVYAGGQIQQNLSEPDEAEMVANETVGVSLKTDDKKVDEAKAKTESSDATDDGSDTSTAVDLWNDATSSAIDLTEEEEEENLKASGAASNVESKEKPPKEQVIGLEPLVGFWAWDNTIRVHKMKMHVGKGADLALHVVLAVLTNQLRYERHAIAAAV